MFDSRTWPRRGVLEDPDSFLERRSNFETGYIPDVGASSFQGRCCKLGVGWAI
jgi:hypothetical protein